MKKVFCGHCGMSAGDCQGTGPEMISMKKDFAAVCGEEVGKEK